MTRLVVTPQADADATAILAYLDSQAGHRVAESYAWRFRETLTQVLQFPEAGAPRPVLGPDISCSVRYTALPAADALTRPRIGLELRVFRGVPGCGLRKTL